MEDKVEIILKNPDSDTRRESFAVVIVNKSDANNFISLLKDGRLVAKKTRGSNF